MSNPLSMRHLAGAAGLILAGTAPQISKMAQPSRAVASLNAGGGGAVAAPEFVFNSRASSAPGLAFNSQQYGHTLALPNSELYKLSRGEEGNAGAMGGPGGFQSQQVHFIGQNANGNGNANGNADEVNYNADEEDEGEEVEEDAFELVANSSGMGANARRLGGIHVARSSRSKAAKAKADQRAAAQRAAAQRAAAAAAAERAAAAANSNKKNLGGGSRSNKHRKTSKRQRVSRRQVSRKQVSRRQAARR